MSAEKAELAGRITMRAAEIPQDEEFLKRLYFERREDLASLPLDDEFKQGLLLMQYTAQASQYDTDFPDADHHIILFDDEPVGRIILDRRPSEIYGVDMALLAGKRGLGIGYIVLGEIMQEAAGSGRRFRFHVDRVNPAKKLYERLGCQYVGETQVNYEMEWTP